MEDSRPGSCGGADSGCRTTGHRLGDASASPRASSPELDTEELLASMASSASSSFVALSPIPIKASLLAAPPSPPSDSGSAAADPDPDPDRDAAAEAGEGGDLADSANSGFATVLSQDFDFEYIHPIDWESDTSAEGRRRSRRSRSSPSDSGPPSPSTEGAARLSIHADQLLTPTVVKALSLEDGSGQGPSTQGQVHPTLPPPPPIVTMVAAADFATRGSDTIPALTVADHTSEALPRGAGTSGDPSNRSCGNTQAASRGSSHGRVPAWSSDDESAPSKTEEHAAPRFKVLLGEPALFFTVPRQSGKPVSLTQANEFGAEQAALALWHVLLELVAYAIGTPALTSSTRSSVSPRCDSPSAAGSLQEDSLPRTVKRLLSGLSRNISRRQAASTIVWVVLPFLAVLCATLVAQQHREIPAPVTPPLESSGDVPVISVDPSVLAEIMGGVSDAREKNLVPTFVPETVKGVLKDGGSHSQSSLSVVGTVKGDLTLAADWRTVKSGTKKVSKLTAQSSCSALSASSVPKDAGTTDAQPQRGSMSLKLLTPSSLSVYSSSHAPETAVRRRSPRVPFSLKNDTGEAAESESDVGNGGATSGTWEETKPGAFDSAADASTQERKREDEAKPKISVGEFHAWSENLRKPIRRIRNAIVDVSSWWVRYLRRTVRGLFVGSDGKVRAREWVKAAASRAKEIRGRVEEAVEAWWTGVFATGEGAEYEAVLAKEQRKRAKKERKEQKKKARKERKKRRAALREARRAARRQARNRKYAYEDDRADFDHDDDDDYDDDDWHDEHCDGFECRSHRAGRALREWGIAANKAATRLQEDAARKLQEATQLMEDTLANWIAWRG